MKTTASSPSSSAQTISRYFHRMTKPGLSKYAQLRHSIINALEDGELQFEDRLPPERTLSDMLSISLGTAQKALSGLAAEGYVVRKQGIGTFAGRARKSIKRTWHYRFTDPETGAHLPVFAHFLSRRLVSAGPWVDHLGTDVAGYVRIDRRISIDDRFNCYSEFYLGASRFGAMLEMPEEKLQERNLKEILATDFGCPTTDAKGAGRLVQLEAPLARHIGLSKGDWALRIAILGRSHGQPISYQKMYVPPTKCEMDMDFSGSGDEPIL